MDCIGRSGVRPWTQHHAPRSSRPGVLWLNVSLDKTDKRGNTTSFRNKLRTRVEARRFLTRVRSVACTTLTLQSDTAQSHVTGGSECRYAVYLLLSTLLFRLYSHGSTSLFTQICLKLPGSVFLDNQIPRSRNTRYRASKKPDRTGEADFVVWSEFWLINLWSNNSLQLSSSLPFPPSAQRATPLTP